MFCRIHSIVEDDKKENELQLKAVMKGYFIPKCQKLLPNRCAKFHNFLSKDKEPPKGPGAHKAKRQDSNDPLATFFVSSTTWNIMVNVCIKGKHLDLYVCQECLTNES